MSDSQTYINAIFDLLSPIQLGTATLGDGAMVKYQKSNSETANTRVNLFRRQLSSIWTESKENRRIYEIVILVRVKATDREEIAQSDLDQLIESITEKLENALSDLDIGNAYPDTEQIISRPRNFNDNYFNEEITIPIRKRVLVNN